MAPSTTGEVTAAPPIVVMGVSAAGKTSVALELARLLDRVPVDADDLHPAANVAKMSAGVPLDDEDRRPWLAVVGARLAEADRPVVACSALKRTYRDQLRDAAPGTVFVHLDGAPELLQQRSASRIGHFMPASLLASQLDTLEPLETDEAGIRIDVTLSVAEIAHRALEWADARDG